MPTPPSVTIPSSEVRLLESRHVDQEFELSVALPLSYAGSEKRYPVLYTLDANGMFGLVTETVRLMQLGRELPQLIVVGIGYPVGGHVGHVLALRTRDYTPTESEMLSERTREEISIPGLPDEIPSGGAAAFLSFIREELVPFVDATYRTDPSDRALVGDSLGGLFGLYTLFHEPDSFGRYVVGSPSIWWDGAVTYKYESALAGQTSALPAKVFMSVGSLEEPGPTDESRDARMVTNVRRLEKLLAERRYDGLELTTHVFDGETHLSVIPATVSRGLRVVFA